MQEALNAVTAAGCVIMAVVAGTHHDWGWVGFFVLFFIFNAAGALL